MVMRLLRGTQSPHPMPPNSLHWVSVLVLFPLLWSIQKTNNQKHKAIIIKLSAGTTPSPNTHVQEVGVRVEPRRGRESPSPHTRGVSQEHFSGSARAVVWVGLGGGARERFSELPAPPRGRRKANWGEKQAESWSRELTLHISAPSPWAVPELFKRSFGF